jgi:endo-1,4-beta-xylanase
MVPAMAAIYLHKCRTALVSTLLLTALACASQPKQQPAPKAVAAPAVQPMSSEEALILPSISEGLKPHIELGVAAEPYLLAEQGAVIAHHFHRLTAENSMKWGEVCRLPDRCDWQKADLIADFARQHGMKMTGHTFVWHMMYPAWLFKDGNQPASKNLVTERLSQHISQMVKRYADVIDNWDVVNEAISDQPDQMWRSGNQPSKWYETFGSGEYVEVAFRLAGEAVAQFAPNTKLYYNDYSIENLEKRNKVLEMVRGLRQKGIRIDGIGIQGHINLKWPNCADLARAIDDFAAQQLLVKISELDVSVYVDDDLDKKVYQPEVAYDAILEQRLAQRYVDVFGVFRDKASLLTSVTFWGLSDDHSWLNGWPIGRKNYPLLLDRTHHPKLAMKRLLEM